MDIDLLKSSKLTHEQKNALVHYLALRDQFDNQIRSLEQRHQSSLVCRAGCSSCCTLESVFPVEAAVLREAIHKIPGDTLEILIGRESGDGRESQADDSCPLLLGGLCRVYPARPFICRSHGLPAAYLDDDLSCYQVSACPKNFADDVLFAVEDLLLMDEINSRLREINDLFCAGDAMWQDMGRIRLKSLCASTIGRIPL